MTYLDYVAGLRRAERTLELRKRDEAQLEGAPKERVDVARRLVHEAERRVEELTRIVADERALTPPREVELAERIDALARRKPEPYGLRHHGSEGAVELYRDIRDDRKWSGE